MEECELVLRSPIDRVNLAMETHAALGWGSEIAGLGRGKRAKDKLLRWGEQRSTGNARSRSAEEGRLGEEGGDGKRTDPMTEK